jgi:uncharacterized protein YyaL (SSP411 family)
VTEHKHTNSLINETSPYLLQHAHNPVDWHAWGEEALGKARAQDKPILLSIGYSACHWCHVMEHESFENEAIAKLMNDNFVNIKVDREERPDLDQIYMNAVQMMTGHGGWPMTMFLTPDGVPFYGGTYFPPDDRYNMPGFPRVLLSVAEAYRAQPDQVGNTATAMLGELRRVSLTAASNELITTELLDSSYRRIAATYDPKNGGFGVAPKFPPAMTLEFLLHTHYRTGRDDALEIVTHTSRRMAEGGIYDQLGGGFHRYSVDAKWLVPHFEKMLYDNALLSRFYLHLFQVTKEDFPRRIAEETLDYVLREMTDPNGSFYSTQDADSEGREGKFFIWASADIVDALGEDDAKPFCDYFNITDEGNFEELNVLNVTDSLEVVAERHQVTLDHLRDVIVRGRKKLFEIRERRVKPARDEKILTAWNGLMLASFAEAAAILERDDYREAARNNARFVLTNMRRDGLLLRTYKDGHAKLNAYLDDYSFFIDGLIALYEATGEINWLEEAVSLTDKMIEEFWDETDGGFFYTGKSHEQLIVRSKDFFDNATPSGNSVAAAVLLRLAVFTGQESYRRHAITTLRLLTDAIRRYPSAFGLALCAIDFYLSSPKEIALIGADRDQLRELSRVVWATYLPNRVMARSSAGQGGELVPLLRDRAMLDGKPTAFVCENYTCNTPVTEANALAEVLGTPGPTDRTAGATT